MDNEGLVVIWQIEGTEVMHVWRFTIKPTCSKHSALEKGRMEEHNDYQKQLWNRKKEKGRRPKAKPQGDEWMKWRKRLRI